MTGLSKNLIISVAALLIIGTPVFAQKASKKANAKTPAVQQPAPRPQRVNPADAVKEVVDRIYDYLNSCTPAEIVDADNNTITDFSKINERTSFKRGDFGLTSYEWGVTYSGMLLASEVTGDPKYSQYAYDRFKLIGKLYPYVDKYYNETGYSMRLSSLHTPRFLDDCGAMCAAMIKATLKDPLGAKEYRGLLDNWFNFVMYKEYRLSDGILARNRPTTNSVWLDDMYMGIPPIAYRAKLMQAERGDLTAKYYAEAVNQILMFKKYLWVPEMNLFRHGWIEGMSEHPNYHWARANGWAMLTMCDVLDVLPANAQGRDEVLDLLRSLIKGVAQYQSPEGTWHQLINRSESYLETSASAMYVYCIAHAINKGWIDKTAYQEIARSGWAGVAKQVNEKGQVENTCVGTGFGWTNTFYESRPVSVFAAHGYGPVLLAAAEMLKLYGVGQNPNGNQQPGMRPTGMPGGMPGGMFGMMTKREEGKPMVFLAGDSTCMNGTGSGNGGLWGWGSFFKEYMTDACVVENNAVGGLSSRTFYNNNWTTLRNKIQEGDFVLIQFGHNDVAPLNTGRARGTLNGTSNESQTVVMEKNGGPEKVYSYGYYIRMMVRQTKMRGGIPIVLSPTPQNQWTSDTDIAQFTDSFNAWCKTVAAEEDVLYIDVNALAGAEYEKLGKASAQSDYFADGVHTFKKGAHLYCDIISKALKATTNPIAKLVK